MAYRNIVFEGGGVLGVAYIGALRELHSRGIIDQLCGYAGSSVGSIAATVLACNASMRFIEEKLTSLDIRSLKDDSYSYAVDAYNLVRHYGFCKGDKLREWCGDVLKELTGSADITFKQVHSLYDSTLVITGTSLNTLSSKHFSYLTHPNMPVRDAIRISASIPYFFRAIHHDGDVFVDGGVLNNYPLSIFDNNAFNTAAALPQDTQASAQADVPQTIDDFIRESEASMERNTEGGINYVNLDDGNVGDGGSGVGDNGGGNGDNGGDNGGNGDNGDDNDTINTNTTHNKCFIDDPLNRTIGLKLVSNNEIHNKWPAVTNIKSFSTNLLEAMMMQIAKGHIRKDDWKRTIKINAGDISSVDFDLTSDQKKWLIEQGNTAAISFLADSDIQRVSSDPVPIDDGLSAGAVYGAIYDANHSGSAARTMRTIHSERSELLRGHSDGKKKKSTGKNNGKKYRKRRQWPPRSH